jgi:hypothetical protein
MTDRCRHGVENGYDGHAGHTYCWYCMMDKYKDSRLVTEVTFTINTYADDSEFLIKLSKIELDNMRKEKILGFSFRKEKYRFLREVAERLAYELVAQLEEMDDE